MLTAKIASLPRNIDRIWNWQDDCFVSDQLAGILEKAIAIYPQYCYTDAMQMLSAINSTFMDEMPQMQPTLIQKNNLQGYQPTYPISTPSPQIYKLTKLQWGLISSGATILISLAGLGLLQLLNPQQNVQTIAESSTSTIENTPIPTNSSTSEPAQTYSNSVSETKLDQVIPSYIALAFSPTNAFTTCPENTKLYLIGETEKFRFAVCGANGKSLYYFGLDKTTGSGIKLSGSDSGFWNGNYLYLPPSYQNTNYTNALLRVYQNNNLLVSHPIISLYKLANKNSPAVSNTTLDFGLSQANKARQFEAKTYAGTMNRGEQAYYLENSKFTNAIEALQTGIKTETENYSYSINPLGNTAVQPIGVAKKDGLKSYSGGVFVTSNNMTIAVVCETEQPSKIPPPAPQLVNDKPQCAPGTILIRS